MTSLKEQKYSTPKEYQAYRQGIIDGVTNTKESIEKRIDEMIQHENETLKINISDDGKIANQASKNTLLLVKEMLLSK